VSRTEPGAAPGDKKINIKFTIFAQACRVTPLKITSRTLHFIKESKAKEKKG